MATRALCMRGVTVGAAAAIRPSILGLSSLLHRPLFNAVRRFASAPSGPTGGQATIIKGGLQIVPEGVWGVKRYNLPSIWLRDNCRCAKCVNQDTLQRNFDTFKIPSTIEPLKAEPDDSGVKVTWSDDNHESHYPWQFIAQYLQHDARKPEAVNLKYWGADIKESPPSVSYEEVIKEDSEEGVAKLTSLIREYGFAFVDGTPFEDPQDTKRLLERIAFIRETHYGGFYDFTPGLAMADTAYTNIALPAHTDTTYFTDPAGLQAFHLLSHSEASGGESLLVDGFRAAQVLYEEDRRAYEALHAVRLPWHASGNPGITIAPDRRYPVLEVEGGVGAESHALHRVRWNNDDRGVVPFEGVPPEKWYDAARKWDEIIKRKESEYWVQLTPGRVLIFDNWRVLHGRSAFEGVRRICGGYINRDDFISRWRNTNFPREEVLDQVIG
ncbi:Trimethyllysine dioxygenase [Pleurostoma richardsiae]|uniref:Trimethyllysine dioxygenase n=1 Tax=Pleurostoma richardsiae TaxID=41990 RepID=A0AA38RLV7_9PEZI|nr:Trimethyllysine dioxygenase [Pleurostoma richardsiae]